MTEIAANALRDGQESYMHYLGGIAILYDPYTDFSRGLHGLDLTVENREDITQHAEVLIYRGLQKVILAAQANLPKSFRGLDKAEDRYEYNLPRIRSIIDSTYQEFGPRIDRINPAFFGIRPAPLTSKVVYRQLCHRRVSKLLTVRLMDGVQPSKFFGDTLNMRRLGNIRGRILNEGNERAT